MPPSSDWIQQQLLWGRSSGGLGSVWMQMRLCSLIYFMYCVYQGSNPISDYRTLPHCLLSVSRSWGYTHRPVLCLNHDNKVRFVFSCLSLCLTHIQTTQEKWWLCYTIGMQITFERLWSYWLWMFFDSNPDNAAGYSTKQAFRYVIFHFKTHDFSCLRQWIPDSMALGSGSHSLRTDRFSISVSHFYCLRVSQWRHWHQRTQFVVLFVADSERFVSIQ